MLMLLCDAAAPADDTKNDATAAADEEIDFPDMIGSDDVSYFFENNDIDGLHWALENVFERRIGRHYSTNSRITQQQQPKQSALPEQLVSRGGGNQYTTKYKIQHDLEQAKHILNEVLLPALQAGKEEEEDHGKKTKDMVQYFEAVVIPTYEEILARIPPLDQLTKTNGLYPFQQNDYQQTNIRSIYNQAIYHTAAVSAMRPPSPASKSIINPNLDMKSIYQRWLSKDPSHPNTPTTPGIMYVGKFYTT